MGDVAEEKNADDGGLEEEAEGAEE